MLINDENLSDALLSQYKISFKCFESGPMS